MDSKPIGMCGILNPATLDAPDIGFAFLPVEEGRGYAMKLHPAVVDHAKNELNIPVLSAITLPDNTNSISLLNKLGFTFVKRFQNEKEEAPELYVGR